MFVQMKSGNHMEMKTNREILSAINLELIKRPLNDREKREKEWEAKKIERDNLMHKCKLVMMEAEHVERMRLISSGLSWGL